jgi:outer membrane protein assembly factor BamA
LHFKKIFFFIYYLQHFYCDAASFVDSNFVVLQSYSVSGNTKTKFRIIAREINFKPQDTIYRAALPALITEYKNRLYNLQLFNNIDCKIDTLPNQHIHLQFTVIENIYFGFSPNANLADRNFNVWLRDFNMNLGRVNYISNFIFRNINGVNKTLQGSLQLGFNNAASIIYTIPNLGKQQNSKLLFSADYLNTRQFHYDIKNDKQLFLKNDNNFIFNKIHAEMVYTKRLHFYKNFTAKLHWNWITISNDLFVKNKKLLPSEVQQINYWQSSLQYDYNNTDNIYFPMAGWQTTLSYNYKFGFAPHLFNQQYLYHSLFRYQPLPNGFHLLIVMRNKIMIQNTDGFYFQRALGFANDYVRGYEYFVINGGHFSISRLEVKKRILQHQLNKKKRFWAPTIPIEIYPKIYSDAGVVSSIDDGYQTSLRNKMLYSVGIGWAIKCGNYAAIRLEYSINHLQQKGLFLHLTSL